MTEEGKVMYAVPPLSEEWSDKMNLPPEQRHYNPRETKRRLQDILKDPYASIADKRQTFLEELGDFNDFNQNLLSKVPPHPRHSAQLKKSPSTPPPPPPPPPKKRMRKTLLQRLEDPKPVAKRTRKQMGHGILHYMSFNQHQRNQKIHVPT